MKPGSRVAVIGCGMAGLACALALQSAGLRVTPFEKSRGAGGRMSTRRGGGWQCDHGAPGFAATDPAFRAQVQAWVDAGVAAPWAPRLRAGDAAPAGLFVGMPAMTAPAAGLARSLAINARTTILPLSLPLSGTGAPGAPWQLASLEAGALPGGYDAVLLAVPAPQAATLLRTAAPTLAAAAERVRMQPCWALMLQYAHPIGLPFEAAAPSGGPLRWVARNNSKPGRGGAESWLLHASAAWSEAHLESAPEAVAPLLLAAFAEMGAPPPQAWVAHRWRYAQVAADTPAAFDGCLWDPARRVGLCGDWLASGGVEGAWLSGHRLAQRVLAA